MNILLDTQAYIWIFENDLRLSTTAKEHFEDPANTIFFSIASIWEVAVKISIGKFKLSAPVRPFFEERLKIDRVNLLPIELSHLAVVETLPVHHRDPFDRLLIAQAIAGQMPVISSDPAFDLYPIARIF